PLLESVPHRRIVLGIVHEPDREINLTRQVVVAIADLAAAMLAEGALHPAGAEGLRRAEPCHRPVAEGDERPDRRAGLLAAVAAVATGPRQRLRPELGRDQAAAAGAGVQLAHWLNPPHRVGRSSGRKP